MVLHHCSAHQHLLQPGNCLPFISFCLNAVHLDCSFRKGESLGKRKGKEAVYHSNNFLAFPNNFLERSRWKWVTSYFICKQMLRKTWSSILGRDFNSKCAQEKLLRNGNLWRRRSNSSDCSDAETAILCGKYNYYYSHGIKPIRRDHLLQIVFLYGQVICEVELILK